MMKKIIMFILIALLLAVTVPVAAAVREPVGDQINIYTSGDQTFPAGQPFHISHGWLEDMKENPVPLGLLDFVLEVDSVVVEEDFRITTHEGPGVVRIKWVHNFPEGMTGAHTFSGHWYAPCSAYGEDCVKRNEILEVWTTTVEVEFLP
jgi:hypothetical protein